MGTKKGNLSIDSENIFPIIKKWVYSDHDIFIRELVSNGCDAITKYKKLDMMGECELPADSKSLSGSFNSVNSSNFISSILTALLFCTDSI